MNSEKEGGRGERPPKLAFGALLNALSELPLRYTVHALERLTERGLIQSHVTQMLRGKTGKRFHSPAHDRWEGGSWKYRIHGSDVDGEKIGAVVAVEEMVIVVTAFSREE
jgi:hypothetical protein